MVRKSHKISKTASKGGAVRLRTLFAVIGVILLTSAAEDLAGLSPLEIQVGLGTALFLIATVELKHQLQTDF